MYPDCLRNLIRTGRNSGKSYIQLSNEFDLSISTIQTLLSYNKKSIKKKTGTKLIIQKRDSLMLKRYISNMNNVGSKVTCRKIIEDNNMNVSRRTMNNWILRNKYKYQKQVQSIQLSKRHKLKRIQ